MCDLEGGRLPPGSVPSTVWAASIFTMELLRGLGEVSGHEYPVCILSLLRMLKLLLPFLE